MAEERLQLDNSGRRVAGAVSIINEQTRNLKCAENNSALLVKIAGGGSGGATATDVYIANDNSFEAGDSPVTIDINTGLGANADDVQIANTGDYPIDVEISTDGATNSTQYRLPARGTQHLTGLSIDSIDLTHTGNDSAYFILAY